MEKSKKNTLQENYFSSQLIPSSQVFLYISYYTHHIHYMSGSLFQQKETYSSIYASLWQQQFLHTKDIITRTTKKMFEELLSIAHFVMFFFLFNILVHSS